MPVPFQGELFTFHNPDGSELTLKGWGNQFHAVFETLDGYTVVKGEDGYYQYAALAENGESLQPTGERVDTADPQTLNLPQHLRVTRESSAMQAREARESLGPVPRWMQRRMGAQAQLKAQSASPDAAPPANPTTGNFRGLVLLIDFSDFPATISRQEVDDFCNKAGYTGFGNNGSAFDYFRDVSDGKLSYKNLVAAYYRAAHPRTYYTDPAISYGTRAQELIREALNSLVAAGFDFSSLTADAGGYIKALSVFYAGVRSNAWSEGLWPHSWALASPYVLSATRRFSDYQITDLGNQLTLRTFCHENGHMVCDFPDLYDYDSVGVGLGVGHYSLMCYGGNDKNPTQVDAYLKHAAGWSSAATTMASGQSYTIAAGRNEFLLHPRSATEYFIVENREQAGRDASLPDSGVAIWHVDTTGNNSNQEMTPAKHYELSLEQADNRFDLERRVNYGDATDLYGGSGSSFGPSSAPNSNWWDGSGSGLDIESVSAVAHSMTVATRNTGPATYYNISVNQVFATVNTQNAWAHVGTLGWRKITTGAPDGITNMLAMLALAQAKGLKVTVVADASNISQCYL